MDTSINNKVEEAVTRLTRQIVTARDQVVIGLAGRRTGHDFKSGRWPMLPGTYAVGDALAPVAICTLASNNLFVPLARLPGVAIAGRAYSANFGIEKIIANVTANPSIRFLLICGKESPYFQVGQAFRALFANGVTHEGQIIGATGHMPQLSHIGVSAIDRLRKQIELVDCSGETNMESLAATVKQLTDRNPGPYQNLEIIHASSPEGSGFRSIGLGGHRESLAYDPMGFFIITLDREAGEIVVHHYWSDHSPAHVVRGRNGEAILLALLREVLISQKSHAAYLGAELVKAETALRLGLDYEQDRPLRQAQPTVMRNNF